MILKRRFLKRSVLPLQLTGVEIILVFKQVSYAGYGHMEKKEKRESLGAPVLLKIRFKTLYRILEEVDFFIKKKGRVACYLLLFLRAIATTAIGMVIATQAATMYTAEGAALLLSV